MRKIILLSLAIIFVCSLAAQETGIRFENGTYLQALNKAKEEGKYLFIDCYTSWCVPCKMLEKEVFTDKAVAEYFNSKFINLRLDVEKGEGVELRKQFGVQPVPTLLFINSDGKVEHKFIGASDAVMFIKLSNEVFTNENRYGVLQRKYDAGNYNLSFLAQYISELIKQSEFSKANMLLSKLMTDTPAEQLCNNDFWPILTHNFVAEYETAVYTMLIKYKDLFIKNVGDQTYKTTMSKLFKRYSVTWIFSGSKNGYDKNKFETLRKEIKSLDLKNGDEVLMMVSIAEARCQNDFNNFISLIEMNFDKLSIEDKYTIFIDSDFLSGVGTSSQCEKFKKLIDRFITESNNENYKSRLDHIIKGLNTKINNIK